MKNQMLRLAALTAVIVAVVVTVIMLRGGGPGQADDLAAEGNADRPPLRFPFRREAEPETVEVVERVLGLARLAAAGG